MKTKTLKTAISIYFKSDFWKKCGVKFTIERDNFIRKVLETNIWKLKSKEELLRIVNFIPELRAFDVIFHTDESFDVLKQILIQYLYWLKPSNVSFIAQIKGCNEIFWFKVKDRKQFIYLIGEHHNYKGNPLEILLNLSKHLSCPIDILVEKTYESYWNEKSFRTYSNIVEFEYPPLDVCSQKGSVPKPENILDKKFIKYYENCVLPMKGRVKIWAIDLRKTSIFNLVSRPCVSICYSLGKYDLKKKIREQKDFKKFYDTVINFQRAVYDFDLAEQDMVSYDNKIKECVFSVYQHIPKSAPYPRFPHAILGQVFDEIVATTDKTHINFAKSVLRFPSSLWKNWQKMCLEKINKTNPTISSMLLSTLHDFYAILRLYRIIQKQKEGIIVFFSGSAHTHFIMKLLETDPFFELLGFLKSKGEEHQVSLPIPLLPCKEKTRMMEVFQSNTLGKKNVS